MDDRNNLSLHRLVQAEYSFQATTQQRQEAFESTTRLLLEVFPHYNNGRILPGDRSKAELYIQHVLSLIFSFLKERDRVDGLNPTLDFLKLISDCTWCVKECLRYRKH